MIGPADGRIGGGSGCPKIRVRIISPARIEIGAGLVSAPHNHFSVSPNCRVVGSGGGCIGGGSGCPGILYAATWGIRYCRKDVVNGSSYNPTMGQACMFYLLDRGMREQPLS